jgi:2-oxoglutarate ferredoxin oxidoreductase subunit alpha
LNAGWNYALKDEKFKRQYNLQPAEFEKGTYRNISGNHAVAIGLVAAAKGLICHFSWVVPNYTCN